VALSALGCSTSDDTRSGGTTPQEGESAAPGTDPSTLTVYYQGDERVFSPAHWVSFRYLVFASLVRVGEGPDGMEPWLADRWEHTDDRRTWTYHLREDARWHDGVPVTTADVEFTLGLLSHPEVMILDPSTFRLEVIDEYTFSVTAETPQAEGFVQWELICFPKHLLEDLEPTKYHDWDFWIEPVGNGPFRYVSHVPATYTELEADPDYFLGRPRIDRLRLRYGGDPVLELLGGTVDLHIWGTPGDVKKLEDDERYVSYPTPGPPMAIFWNLNRPQFRDAETRMALTLALDRRELFQTLRVPDEVPVLDAPFNLESEETPPDPLPHDPGRARQLLSEASWADTDGNGVLERDGEEFRFELLVFGPGVDASVLVQNYLQQVGVAVEIQTLQMGATRTRMNAGEFEAGIFRTGRGYLENFLLGARNPLEVRAQGRSSPIGYSNPELLAAAEGAAESSDPSDRKQLRELLWQTLQRDVPATFLHPEMDVVIAHRDLRGVAPPYQRVLYRLDRAWLEEH
jgi:peptide/nickel transport system substrate-binding protein